HDRRRGRRAHFPGHQCLEPADVGEPSTPAASRPRNPKPGIRGLSLFRTWTPPTRQEENEMSTTVLDAPALGAGVDVEQLPCRREDPELFFAESPSDVALAKSLCGGCPVRAECLAAALERREPWGVWGGQLFIAGVVVPRKRPRGRPRKNDVAAA